MTSPSVGSDDCTDGIMVKNKGKPCNLWNAKRQVKKSCVADTLDALRQKGRAKLGIADDRTVRVVLELDGTEVDDEDYFACLEDFCTFIFLTDKEEWSPKSSTAMFSDYIGTRSSKSGCVDATDGCEEVDGAGAPVGDCHAERLFSHLCEDSAYKQLLPWLLLRPTDLEEIVNVDPETLYSKHPRQVVDEIQEMSSKALNDYNSAQKAVELLNLYDKAAGSRSKV